MRLFLSNRKKFLYIIFAAILACGSLLSLAEPVHAAITDNTVLFRFWNPYTNHYFYTRNVEERNSLVANNATYEYQTEAYNTYTSDIAGTVPVYRFWRNSIYGHYYTIDETEKNQLQQETGTVLEKIEYYVYTTAQEGTVPVYRFWNESYKTQFFTVSDSERSAYQANSSWQDQGIAFYTKANVNDNATTVSTIRVIGRSVENRPIYAFYFGNGRDTIVFYANIHGNETNTKDLLHEWVKDLETNKSRIPLGRKVIIVTTLNPDGLAHNSRLNIHETDLNRNFGASDWQQVTYLNGGIAYPNGGGSGPFSEPETVALRDLMKKEIPYLTIAYHCQAGYVISNMHSYEKGYSSAYVNLSGYMDINPYSGGGAFDYATTGSFNLWAEENGFSGITLELATCSLNEYSRNSSAMWSMVRAKALPYRRITFQSGSTVVLEELIKENRLDLKITHEREGIIY